MNKDRFYTFSLEGNLILFDRGNRFIILTEKGRFIWEEFSKGILEDEIKLKYKGLFGGSPEEVENFFDLLFSNIEDNISEENKSSLVLSPSVVKKYRIFGKNVLFGIGESTLENLIESPISKWEKEFVLPPDVRFDFLKDKTQYVFCVNKREVIRDEDFFYVRGVSLYEMVNALFPDKTWIGVFHGASLKGKYGVIILSGESGSGKSTLNAYLTRKGYDSLSDDMILLDNETNIMETPFGISLKRGSWDILSLSIPVESIWTQKIKNKEIRYYFPPQKQKRTRPLIEKPNVLFLVKYREGSPTLIRKVTKTDALIGLVQGGAWISPHPKDVSLFMEWLEGIPAYELIFSELKGVERLLDEVLSEYN